MLLNLRRGVYERVAEQSGDVAGLIARWMATETDGKMGQNTQEDC